MALRLIIATGLLLLSACSSSSEEQSKEQWHCHVSGSPDQEICSCSFQNFGTPTLSECGSYPCCADGLQTSSGVPTCSCSSQYYLDRDNVDCAGLIALYYPNRQRVSSCPAP